MDTDLAATFIEIVRSGSFQGAGERLNVTQSTISKRMERLEDLLGQRLLVRNKAGVSLTLAGERFHVHARSFLRVWDDAVDEVGIPEAFSGSVRIGCQHALWRGFGLRLLKLTARLVPDIRIKGEMAAAPRLVSMVQTGALDVAVLDQPELRPGIEVEHVFDETLVMVSRTEKSLRSIGSDYVHINWGPEFSRAVRQSLPAARQCRLDLSLGTLGIDLILQGNTVTYQPLSSATPFLKSGLLQLVRGAPAYLNPCYAMALESRDAAAVRRVRSLLNALGRSRELKDKQFVKAPLLDGTIVALSRLLPVPDSLTTE